MRYTVTMVKKYTNGNTSKLEIHDDPNYCFGHKKPKGKYFVFAPRCYRNYRATSLVEEYKYWKSQGYKVVRID